MRVSRIPFLSFAFVILIGSTHLYRSRESLTSNLETASSATPALVAPPSASSATAVPTSIPCPNSLTPRYLVFDVYRGRFGNQLLQIEWAYRLAHLANRSLVLRPPRKEYAFNGLPILTNYSIWDPDALGTSPVKLHLHPSSNWTGPAPNSSSCVWTERSGKFMVSWVLAVNGLPECATVIHLRSAKGLASEYRTDTRGFGIDPLLFWKHFRFHPAVFAQARARLSELKIEPPVIGLHARTFREVHTSAEHAMRSVCRPITREIRDKVSANLANRKRCGCPLADVDLNALLRQWDRLNMYLTCNISHHLSFLLDRSPEELRRRGFFAATDRHFDIVPVLERAGARIFNFSAGFPIPELPNPADTLFATKNQFLIVDLAALILVDEFHGVPSSSLTASVCYWRAAMGASTGVMCKVLALRAVSPRCSESRCDAFDAACCGL